MKKNTIMNGAFVALCLICMLVLPAAAAPASETTSIRAAAIDDGLREDLWASHKEHRLEIFDLRVNHAADIIRILENHGADTTACQSTLSEIRDMRQDLERALTSHDLQEVKAVNEELKTLAQQFIRNVREAVQNAYGTRTTAMTGISADAPGF